MRGDRTSDGRNPSRRVRRADHDPDGAQGAGEYPSPVAYDPNGTYAVDVFDVEYRRAGREAWLARVYQPRGPGPFPALLDVHGGVWMRADRLVQAPIDQALAASGLVVVAIDFRHGVAHPYPSSLEDINYAVRWLTGRAAAFNADARILG